MYSILLMIFVNSILVHIQFQTLSSRDIRDNMSQIHSLRNVTTNGVYNTNRLIHSLGANYTAEHVPRFYS
jgi:hypothetical protein